MGRVTRFTFSIEYQKGQENVAADALSIVTLKLDAGTMKSILDGVTVGIKKRVDAHNLAVAVTDEEFPKQVQETVILARATQVCVDLHVTDWVTAQQKDPILKPMIKWISNQKVQDMKHLLEGDTELRRGTLSSKSRRS